MLKSLLAGLAGLVLATAVHADDGRFVEGTHYRVLDTPANVADPDRIEVREFFFYGCPHCYNVQPLINAWKENQADDVNFVPTPVLFIRGAEPLARAFYVARSKGILDEVHIPIFQAIHEHREALFEARALARFFRAYGVEAEEFNDLYSSFGVSTRVRQADALSREYRITGTPAFAVAGKYVVLRQNLANDRETFQVIDYLVEKERRARN